jgi:hypothetical protein
MDSLWSIPDAMLRTAVGRRHGTQRVAGMDTWIRGEPDRRPGRDMEARVLSWDDASNNRFLISAKGSWIANPQSHYLTAKTRNMPITQASTSSSCRQGPRDSTRRHLSVASHLEVLEKCRASAGVRGVLLYHSHYVRQSGPGNIDQRSHGAGRGGNQTDLLHLRRGGPTALGLMAA